MSHHVYRELRRIGHSELPLVPTFDPAVGTFGGPRPATPQELLDRGIVHLSGDVYSCVSQERVKPGGDPRNPDHWQPATPEPPGEVLSEGAPEMRLRRLGASDRPSALRVRVFRSTSSRPAGAVLDAAVRKRQGRGKADLVSIAEMRQEARALLDEVSPPATRRGRAAPKLAPIVEVIVAQADVRADDFEADADAVLAHHWQGEVAP